MTKEEKNFIKALDSVKKSLINLSSKYYELEGMDSDFDNFLYSMFPNGYPLPQDIEDEAFSIGYWMETLEG